MLVYLVRKFFLTLSIVFGVVAVTFLLFHVVARHPERAFAGKSPSKEVLQAKREEMGLDKSKPEQFWRALTFRFPNSMRYQESVWSLYARKAPVSLAIQLPAFLIELGLQLAIAIYIASRRGSALDISSTLLAVIMLSIPPLSLYLGVQYFFGVKFPIFPVAGWGSGFMQCVYFAALPILVTVVGGLGGPVRFYRTVALEEINNDYIRTARSKGVGESDVMLVHVMRNLLIPAVTQTIVQLPALLTGALILESMFQIPGLGGLLVSAIATQDSAVVISMTYLTAILYAIALFATDICYTIVDPRVVLR